MSDTQLKKPTYSVVVPVFNSEDSLEELLQGIDDIFRKLSQSFEVIFVNDSSTDQSWNKLKEMKSTFKGELTAINLNRNFGQHNATLCGFGFAKGDRIITIDDDLQTPPSEIEKLIIAFEHSDADIVYGVYGKKKHSALRNFGSSSLKKSSRVLHNSPGDGSSFRLIKSEIIQKMVHHQQNFIFLDEILFWYTNEIDFVVVQHLPRKYKQSTYSMSMLVRMFANILLYYTMIPLKFLIYGGLFFSIITFFYGSYFIVKKLVYNVPLGYTSLIVTILFSTSIMLFSLGIIGEYLSRIYMVQNRKPPFSIKKVI